MMNKNLYVAMPTERFFDEILMKKDEYFGLNYDYTEY